MTEWRNLSESQLEKLTKYKSHRDYQSGEILYHQGDECHGLYCVQSGVVGLRRFDIEGRSSLIKLASPGDTVGYRALLGKSPHVNTAEILKDSRICFIDRSIVHEMLLHEPTVGERFLARSLSDMERLEANYMRAKNLTTREQLLHFLMILYEQFGEQDESGRDYIMLPIARKDIAELIGATPESISRTIKKLEMEQLVRFEGRMAQFRDISAIFDQIGAYH